MLRYCELLLISALFFFTLLVGAPVACTELDCVSCQINGYPYLCRVHLSDASICFGNSGDVHCSNGFCTCCRKTPARGCTARYEYDNSMGEDDVEEEDL